MPAALSPGPPVPLSMPAGNANSTRSPSRPATPEIPTGTTASMSSYVSARSGTKVSATSMEIDIVRAASARRTSDSASLSNGRRLEASANARSVARQSVESSPVESCPRPTTSPRSRSVTVAAGVTTIPSGFSAGTFHAATQSDSAFADRRTAAASGTLVSTVPESRSECWTFSGTGSATGGCPSRSTPVAHAPHTMMPAHNTPHRPTRARPRVPPALLVREPIIRPAAPGRMNCARFGLRWHAT